MTATRISKESLIDIITQAEIAISDPQSHLTSTLEEKHDLVNSALTSLELSRQANLINAFKDPLQFCEKNLDMLIAERKRPRPGSP